MKEITLPLVLQFLKDNAFMESFLTLEAESKTSLHHYPKEVEFFRKILMKGDFTKASQFLWTFENRIPEDSLRSFSLDLFKQKLYELLENPDENELRNLFEREIINYCSEEEYQQLFTMLTCKSIRETDGMQSWSPILGRYQCFQKISPTLQTFFPSPTSYNNPPTPPFLLEDAVADYLSNHKGPSVSKRHPSTDKQSIDEKLPPAAAINRSIHSLQKSSHNNKGGHSQLKQVGQSLDQIELGQSKVQTPADLLPIKSNLQSSTFNKKYNPYIEDKSNVAELSKSRQPKHSNLYSKQLKVEDIEEARGQVPVRSHQLSYLKEFQKSPHQSEYQSQVKRNIAYLDKNQSQARDTDQNFTFSHGTEESGFERNRKVLKLASVLDSKAIRTCQFSSSGNYFALGTNSSYLKIFEISELFATNLPQQIEPIYQIPQLHSKSIFSLDWSLNEKSIITCSNDLTVKLTEFPEGFNYASHKTTNIGRHESCIRMVKFNSMETKVVSCGDDSLIKIWDMGKNKRCANLKGHSNSVSGFKFAGEEDNVLCSVSKDSTIRKWDLRMEECVRVSSPQDSEMTYIANHTERITVSHKNGCVSFFDDDLKLEHSCQVHEQEIRSIDGLSYDDTLLTASFDGHISLFSEETLESPNYHQHNDVDDDKVVYATFLNHPHYRGFASTSTMGLCNIFSYQ